jgi:hypothetical protein
MNNRRQFRQGDVLVMAVDSIPDGATAVPLDGGRIVLALGEATGHAHAIAVADPVVGVDADARLLALGDRRFLEVSRPSTIRHEEHAPVPLAPGLYEVVRQREYSPEAIRNVAD